MAAAVQFYWPSACKFLAVNVQDLVAADTRRSGFSEAVSPECQPRRPEQTAFCVSRWLATHRKIRDVRPWQRTAAPYAQAAPVLAWFKDATDIAVLAGDARTSIATAYLHEAIDVIAADAPDLADVLDRGLRAGWGFACLDGIVIPSVRS